jgi:hypothetical protein
MTMTLNDHMTIAEKVLQSFEHRSSQPRFCAESLLSFVNPVISLPRVVSTGIAGERLPQAFSMAYGHYRLGLHGHNGSMAGQACAVRLYPKYNFALAVGLNAWSPYARDAIIDRTVALCFEGEPTLKSENSRRAVFDIEDLAGGYALSSLSGMYLGSYHGCVRVIESKDGLRFVFGKSNDDKTTAMVRKASDDHYVLRSRAPVSIGFFRDPVSRNPALMVGMHAYKKD